MLRVTPFYVYRVSNPSTGFKIIVGVFESRGTVLYGVWVFYSLNLSVEVPNQSEDFKGKRTLSSKDVIRIRLYVYKCEHIYGYIYIYILGVERVGNFDTGSGMALEEKTDTGSAPGRVCVMTRYN